MLVVSNFDLTNNLRVMKPAKFLASTIKDFTLNLNNDYRYMKTGYYVSLHAEILGNRVIPSSENIIDSSRTPILLLRAARAGIPTLPFIVTDSIKKIISEIGLPVVLYAVNPFIQKVDGKGYLSCLQPIEKNELAPNDLRTISKEVSLIPMQGEFISG